VKLTWKKRVLPKSTSDWLIFVGFIVYLVSQILKLFFPPIDPLNPQGGSWIAKIVGDTGFILAVTVLIVSGLRSLRRQGFSWKRIIRPVLGVGISLSYISVCYYGYYVFSYGEKTFLRWNERQLPKLVEMVHQKDLPPAERSKYSKLIAAESYYVNGQAIEYLGNNGEGILFEPTQKDIEMRDVRIEGEKTFEVGKRMMLRGSIKWVTALIIGLAIGILAPIRDRGATQNHSLKTTCDKSRAC